MMEKDTGNQNVLLDTTITPVRIKMNAGEGNAAHGTTTTMSHLSLMLAILALVLVSGLACGCDDKKQKDEKCPTECLDDCDAQGVCNQHGVTCPTECPDDCDAQGVCNQHGVTCPTECPDDCDAQGVCNQHGVTCPTECPDDCDAQGVCNQHGVTCPTECPDDCDAQGVCNQHGVTCPIECPDDCDAQGVCNQHGVTCPTECPDDCDAQGVCNVHPVTCPDECLDDCDAQGVCNEHPVVCPDECPDSCNPRGLCCDGVVFYSQCYTKDSISDLIIFGEYRTKVFDANEKESIYWKILDVDIQKNQILLLPNKIIDHESMNYNVYDHAYYKDSKLRSFLNKYDSSQNTDGIDYTNGSFYNFIDNAFTDDEVNRILTTKIDYPDIEGNPTTYDKVFLLSKDEVEKYLSGDMDMYRVACPAFYAADSIGNNNTNKDAYCLYNYSSIGSYDWWLRDSEAPSDDFNPFVLVNDVGEFDICGSDWPRGVRPAIWVSGD